MGVVGVLLTIPIFMNTLTPSKISAYFTYQCPHCDSLSDMMRMEEVSIGKYICWNCNKSIELKPIFDVTPVYKQNNIDGLSQQNVQDAISIVSEYTDDAELLVKNTLARFNCYSIAELVQLSLSQIKDE